MRSRPHRAPRLAVVGGHASRALPDPRLTSALGQDDEELVRLSRDRDRVAFEALYRRHAAFAMNLAVRIQGSASEVDDIVHDAFLRAYQSMGELRDGAAFRSWLGSIVVRLVRSRLRRRRLLGVLGLNAPDPVDLDSIAAGDAGPEARVLLAQVYSLLQTLPPDDRIAWTLRFIERHNLEAVAALTECSLATAKRRIARAQRYLEQRFVAPFTDEEAS
jgi:RNA polymerase sigma-70 factor, ECF subfamily